MGPFLPFLNKSFFFQPVSDSADSRYGESGMFTFDLRPYLARSPFSVLQLLCNNEVHYLSGCSIGTMFWSAAHLSESSNAYLPMTLQPFVYCRPTNLKLLCKICYIHMFFIPISNELHF